MKEEKTLEAIVKRCQGECYIGIVGPVRSGKSTFITKFMENKILPLVTDDFLKNKIIDELPQTSKGKTIMTVEPKFIPNNAITINIGDTQMNTRLVDSVGFVIPNASGHFDDNGPKMVKTPWFDDPIPFKEAAEIGTKKVILNHSNIGILITSDGTFSDFERNDYASVEDIIVNELKGLKKPFVIVLNTLDPKASSVIKLQKDLEKKYQVSVIPTNVLNMDSNDIDKILKEALNEFEIKELNILLPKYISVLNDDNHIKKDIMNLINESTKKYSKYKEIESIKESLINTKMFKEVKIDLTDVSIGVANITLELDDQLYDEIIMDLLGYELTDKADIIQILQEYVNLKNSFSGVKSALDEVMNTGYGVSYPSVMDMKLLEPVVTEQSGRYGVKLKAIAPSIHMIRVDVESTFEPIIGSFEQSTTLINSLMKDEDLSTVWNKEIFGRKLSELVNDGIKSKINMMPDKAKLKLQESLQKIVNTGSGGLIAIIL
jgi:stage IV sporulation protein A